MDRVLRSPEKPLLTIFGGAKVSDKIEIIKNYLGVADAILIGGAMSYTFLKAQGHEVGKSLVEADKLELALELLKEAKEKGTRLLIPVDHVVAPEFAADSPASITSGVEIPADQMGLDIGPETIALYGKEIKASKTILWNGPMGVFEMDAFAVGTMTMAEELAVASATGAFVVLGGGDSVSAANKAGVAPRISHISTGGGASLEYLSGLTLPGVAALQL
jgi:3-phosphoglycerate kinase